MKPTARVAAVVVLGVLVAAPYINYVGWFGDEGVAILGASRMLAGERLYRDIFAFLPPGSYLITAAWLGLFGEHLLVARGLAIVLCGGTAAVIFVGAARVTRPWFAAVLALWWCVSTQGQWTIVSHHWMSGFFTVAACAVGLAVIQDGAAAGREVTRRVALVGVLLGAAVLCTPSRGGFVACAMAVAMLRFGGPRLVAALVAGSLIPVAACALWLVAQGTLHDAVEGVRFTTERYAGVQKVPFGKDASNQNRYLGWGFPWAVGLAVALRCWPRRDRRGDLVIEAAALLACGGMASAWPRPDGPHIAFAAGPAMLLVAHLAGRLGPPEGPRWRRGALGLSLVLVTGATAAGYGHYTMWSFRVPSADFPRGRARTGFNLKPTEVANALPYWKKLPAGTVVLAYPYQPLLPWLLRLKHPARHDVFVPGYTRRADYRDACLVAAREAEYLINDTWWSSPSVLSSIFPGMPREALDDVAAFDRALGLLYESQNVSGRYILARRRAIASTAACDELVKRAAAP